jgi:hypothetical protein
VPIRPAATAGDVLVWLSEHGGDQRFKLYEQWSLWPIVADDGVKWWTAAEVDALERGE